MSFRSEQEPFEREAFRIARGQFETFIERFEGLISMVEAELKFRNPHPGGAETRRFD